MDQFFICLDKVMEFFNNEIIKLETYLNDWFYFSTISLFIEEKNHWMILIQVDNHLLFLLSIISLNSCCLSLLIIYFIQLKCSTGLFFFIIWLCFYE